MTSTLTRNTALMTVASVLQKFISFAYFTVVARSLGVTGTGKYFLALSMTTIAVIFVDLGLTNVFIREAAKDRGSIQDKLSQVLGIKFFLGLLTYAGLAGVVYLLGYEADVRLMILVSGVTMLFDSLHLSIYGAFRALEDLRFESFSIPASQAITLMLGTLSLYLGLPPVFLIASFTVASVCNVVFASVMLYRHHQIVILPQWSTLAIKQWFLLALPFAISGVCARVYGYADTVMLSKLGTHEMVGWYSVPYKITFAFQFIPLALVAALYPRLSAYAVSDKKKLNDAFTDGMIYLCLISFPIAVGISVLAPYIIAWLYGPAYLPSVLPLRLLVLSLIFSFASFPVGALLNATHRQSTQTAIVASVMVINILLNVFLIPLFGASGAAFSALMGNIFLTVIGLFFVPKILGQGIGLLLRRVSTICLSALVMGGAIVAVTHVVPWMWSMPVAVVVYTSCLFLTGAVTRGDVRDALLFFKK